MRKITNKFDKKSKTNVDIFLEYPYTNLIAQKTIPEKEYLCTLKARKVAASIVPISIGMYAVLKNYAEFYDDFSIFKEKKDE